MPDPYLRNVPADVIHRLTRLATRDHASVSAVAIRELADVSRRAGNPALLAALPDTGISLDDVVETVNGGRPGR